MRSKGWGTYTSPPWRRISAIVSSSVIPRGIFSSMKSPITSPWSAVFTSSPTITLTPYSAALARASWAPETSLWSVTAIAPSPTSRAVASSTSTGVAQSLEWSVCMCRSTSISGRFASRARTSGRPAGGVVAQAGQLGVDLLHLVRHARPRQLVPLLLAAGGEHVPQAGVAQHALQLGGEHVDVAGLEQQPEVTVAQHLLVDGHARRHRQRAGPERPHEHAGGGDLADRGGHHHVGGRERRRLVVGHVHARPQAGAQRRDRAGARVDDGLPLELLGQPPQRAQEQPQ